LIPPHVIESVRSRTDIVKVIGEHVKLTRRGRSFVGLCPFHKERSPSFQVSPERGFYHCFGCNKSGNAIGFLMDVEGLPFPEALAVLAERAGIELVHQAVSHQDKAEAEGRKKEITDLYEAMRLASVYYQEQLRKPGGEPGRAELARRGLDVESTSDFRLGYAPAGWDGLATFFKAQGVSPALAEKVGLLVPRQGGGWYDRFRHRLMFPVLDSQARVVAFSGRILPDEKGETPKDQGKYVNSPETTIYRKSESVFGLTQARTAIRDADGVVLVEGNFDVVSLHARGVQNVVAPLGTAFTVEQARVLRRITSTVTVLFDGDRAGRAAAAKALGPCREAGLAARGALLPDGIDPDELARRDLPLLERLLAGAGGLLEQCVMEALGADLASAPIDEVRARLHRVVVLLSQENDPVLRLTAGARAEELVQELHPGTTLGALLQRVARPAPAQHAVVDDVAIACLGAVIDFPPLAELVLAEPCLLDDEERQVVAAAQATDPVEAAQALPPAWRPIFQKRASRPAHRSIDDARLELTCNLERLRRRNGAPPQRPGGQHRTDVLAELAALERRAQRRQNG
jgi:DNA primase